MTQTLALFLDAYRELNARKLFWITLIISGLVVMVFALVSITEEGLRIVVWDLPVPGFNSTVVPVDTFYKLMFVNLGIGFWLGWVATILALVTTAGIFPDFISAGSIDLVLAKPMGRLRLFLTKYMTGLLFVALQVTVFSVASFFVLGFKGGTWEPAVLLAVPIVTIFYSYLFCICALLGLITRSTIAALMLTLLAWFLIFAIHATESGILTGKLMNEQQSRNLQASITRSEAALERLRKREGEIDVAAASAPIQKRLDDARDDLDRNQGTSRTLDTAHDIAIGVKTVLPKTTETIDLLERWMVDLAELPGMTAEPDEVAEPDEEAAEPRRRDVNMEQLQREAIIEIRNRSPWWIIGTSLLFECFVLGLGAWIFCRRDF